eukprot:497823-Hanusia_phi.AAC.1
MNRKLDSDMTQALKLSSLSERTQATQPAGTILPRSRSSGCRPGRPLQEVRHHRRAYAVQDPPRAFLAVAISTDGGPKFMRISWASRLVLVPRRSQSSLSSDRRCVPRMRLSTAWHFVGP